MSKHHIHACFNEHCFCWFVCFCAVVYQDYCHQSFYTQHMVRSPNCCNLLWSPAATTQMDEWRLCFLCPLVSTDVHNHPLLKGGFISSSVWLCIQQALETRTPRPATEALVSHTQTGRVKTSLSVSTYYQSCRPSGKTTRGETGWRRPRRERLEVGIDPTCSPRGEFPGGSSFGRWESSKLREHLAALSRTFHPHAAMR